MFRDALHIFLEKIVSLAFQIAALHSLEPAKPAPGPTRIKEPNAEVLQTPYTAAQLALRYGFPVLTESSKFWVAIIELSTPVGTGYSPKDVTKYCKQVQIIPSIPLLVLQN